MPTLCEQHDYWPVTRRGIIPSRGRHVGCHVCKVCGHVARIITPDMTVRNTVNGKRYRVRSVNKTKAVCWPLQKNGKRRGSTAIEFAQSNLEIIHL